MMSLPPHPQAQRGQADEEDFLIKKSSSDTGTYSMSCIALYCIVYLCVSLTTNHIKSAEKPKLFDSVREFKVNFLFDTTIPGNLNHGHEFNDGKSKGIIGRKFSRNERLELIEYLKVLDQDPPKTNQEVSIDWEWSNKKKSN